MRHQQVNNFGRSSKAETPQTLNCSRAIPRSSQENPECSFFVFTSIHKVLQIWCLEHFFWLNFHYLKINVTLSFVLYHVRILGHFLNIQFSGKICCCCQINRFILLQIVTSGQKVFQRISIYIFQLKIPFFVSLFKVNFSRGDHFKYQTLVCSSKALVIS